MRLGALLILLVGSICAQASAPDWFRQAARIPVPALPDEPVAVVLLNEQTIKVNDHGDRVLVTRWAAKILRPGGANFGVVAVGVDDETRVTYLKAWSITASGQEYELKEKDAMDVDVAAYLYGDARSKVLSLPGREPGTIIGYECEQKQRPYVNEHTWLFDQRIPVLKSVFQLQLAKGWQYETFWRNHAPVEPAVAGNMLTWEVSNLPAIKDEPMRPPYRALAASMVLHLSSGDKGANGAAARWKELGAWYEELFRSRTVTTPAINAQVAELLAGATSDVEKIRRLAAYVQSGIRYVDIEVGIGGLQPHPAGEIFTRRLGDCKDKVTLLVTMLREAGIHADPLLIDTTRGAVTPGAPGIIGVFNHVIAAITLPPNTDLAKLPATLKIDGKDVLLFDPTYEMLSVGLLPDSLQDTYALLVRAAGGALIKTPLLAPEWNAVRRTGEMQLGTDGALTGEIVGAMTGTNAVSSRYQILSEAGRNREKLMEQVISAWMPAARITDSSIEGAQAYDSPLKLRVKVKADNYAKSAGVLLLVRPHVVRFPAFELDAKSARVTPVHFRASASQVDEMRVKLPPGFVVDELPSPVDVKFDFGEYHSATKFADGVLTYRREFILRQPVVPAEQFTNVQKFLRQIAIDERSSAVLKKVQ